MVQRPKWTRPPNWGDHYRVQSRYGDDDGPAHAPREASDGGAGASNGHGSRGTTAPRLAPLLETGAAVPAHATPQFSPISSMSSSGAPGRPHDRGGALARSVSSDGAAAMAAGDGGGAQRRRFGPLSPSRVRVAGLSPVDTSGRARATDAGSGSSKGKGVVGKLWGKVRGVLGSDGAAALGSGASEVQATATATSPTAARATARSTGRARGRRRPKRDSALEAELEAELAASQRRLEGHDEHRERARRVIDDAAAAHRTDDSIAHARLQEKRRVEENTERAQSECRRTRPRAPIAAGRPRASNATSPSPSPQ